jgi:hypothetical protein
VGSATAAVRAARRQNTPPTKNVDVLAISHGEEMLRKIQHDLKQARNLAAKADEEDNEKEEERLRTVIKKLKQEKNKVTKDIANARQTKQMKQTKQTKQRKTSSPASPAPPMAIASPTRNITPPLPPPSVEETELTKEEQMKQEMERKEKRKKAIEAAKRIRERNEKHLKKLINKRQNKGNDQEERDKRKLAQREKLKHEMLTQAAAARKIKEEKNRLEKEKIHVKTKEELKQERMKKKKLEEAKHQAFMNRLSETEVKRLDKMETTETTDEKKWRSQHGVEEDQNVFVVTGHYPDIVDEMLSRGWYHNEDRESAFYDLKWTIQSNHIKHKTLNSKQIVNHFSKASSIVTKVGLMRNLRSLRWFASVDPDLFFPRCYDVTQSHEMDDFILDYKQTRALSILQSIIQKSGIAPTTVNRRPATRLGTARKIPDRMLSRKKSSFKGETSSEEEDSSCPSSPCQDEEEEEVDEEEEDAAQEDQQSSTSTSSATVKPLDFAHTWNDDDDTYLPTALGLLAKAVADRTSQESIEVNRAVFQTAFSVIEKMVNTHFKPHETSQKNGDAENGTGSGAVDGGGGDDGWNPSSSVSSVSASSASSASSSSSMIPNKSDKNDDDGCNYVAQNISPYEWKHLDDKRVDVFVPGSPKEIPQTKKQERQAADDKKKEHDMKTIKQDELRKKKRTSTQNVLNNITKKYQSSDYELFELNDDDLLQILILLDQHKCIPFSQANLSGVESKNVWIVKPAGKSRGRGIQCLNDLDEIVNVTRTQDGRCAESQWVIQKYIENPMIIHKRKFDIRQWVLGKFECTTIKKDTTV